MLNELKQRTLQRDNLRIINGYWRYINHKDKLATVGFTRRTALIKYTNDIRFDEATIELMKSRYKMLFVTF